MPGTDGISWHGSSSGAHRRYGEVNNGGYSVDDLESSDSAAAQSEAYDEYGMTAAYVNNNSNSSATGQTGYGYGYSNTGAVPRYGGSNHGHGVQSTLAGQPTFNVEIFNDFSGTFQPVWGTVDDGMNFSPGTVAPPNSALPFGRGTDNGQGVAFFEQEALSSFGDSVNPSYPAQIDLEDAGNGEQDSSLSAPHLGGSRGRSPSLSGLPLTMERTYPGHMYTAEHNLVGSFNAQPPGTPLSSRTSDYAATTTFANTLTPATSQNSYLQWDGGAQALSQTAMADMPFVPQAQIESFAIANAWEPGTSNNTAHELANGHPSASNALSRLV